MEKEQIAKHIVEWNKEKRKMPLKAELRLTFKCNLHCFHCPNRVNEPAKYIKDLPDEIWIKVVKECADLGIKECMLFGGGEPFTRLPLLLKLAHLVKKFEMQGETQTNGTFLTKKVAERLVNMGWDQILISLDGPNARIHDFIRGRGVFKRIIKNIKIINRLKRKNKRTKPSIIFTTVMNNLVYDKLNDMISLAHKLSVRTVLFRPLDIRSSGAKKLELNEDQISKLRDCIQEAKDKSRKLDINTNVETYFDERWIKDSWKKRDQVRENKKKNFFSLPCYLPFYFISIREEGDVEPCHTIRNPHESVESVLKKSLKDIWFGQHFQQIRRNLIRGKLLRWCSECCAMDAVEHEKLQNIIKQKLH